MQKSLQTSEVCFHVLSYKFVVRQTKSSGQLEAATPRWLAACLLDALQVVYLHQGCCKVLSV